MNGFSCFSDCWSAGPLVGQWSVVTGQLVSPAVTLHPGHPPALPAAQLCRPAADPPSRPPTQSLLIRQCRAEAGEVAARSRAGPLSPDPSALSWRRYSPRPSSEVEVPVSGKKICPSPSDVRESWQLSVRKLSEAGLCPKFVRKFDYNIGR